MRSLAHMTNADAATSANTMDNNGIVIRDRNRHYQNGNPIANSYKRCCFSRRGVQSCQALEYQLRVS